MGKNLKEQADRILQERLNSGNYTKRDQHLAQFIAVWKPLTDHVQELANTHFPADKRVRTEFFVDEVLNLRLKFIIQTDKAAEDPSYAEYKDDVRWWQTSTLDFIRTPSIALVSALSSPGNAFRKLTSIFRSKNGTPGNDAFAVTLLDIGERDQKLCSISIHPDKMEAAKDLLEYWLAKNMAFQFDRDAINPVSAHEIIIKNTVSGPDSRPK